MCVCPQVTLASASSGATCWDGLGGLWRLPLGVHPRQPLRALRPSLPTRVCSLLGLLANPVVRLKTKLAQSG